MSGEEHTEATSIKAMKNTSSPVKANKKTMEVVISIEHVVNMKSAFYCPFHLYLYFRETAAAARYINNSIFHMPIPTIQSHTTTPNKHHLILAKLQVLQKKKNTMSALHLLVYHDTKKTEIKTTIAKYGTHTK